MDPLNTEVQNEKLILDKMRAIREPEQEEPTGELDAVDASEEVDSDDEDSEELEPEIIASDEDDEQDNEEVQTSEESLFYEIDGEEISLEQVMDWKNGYLRQSDYTKKTQGVAASLKDLEADKLSLKEKSTSLDKLIADMEGMLDTPKDVDWEVGDDGLPVYDDDFPKFQRHKAEQDKRRKAAKEAKEHRKAAKDIEVQENMLKEQEKLLAALPTWQDAKQREADITLINDYVVSKGISQEKVNSISNHLDMITLLDAAKYARLQKKNAKVSKKVTKAPKVIKPGKAKKPTRATAIDDAKSKARKSGNPDDILAAMKLMRGS